MLPASVILALIARSEQREGFPAAFIRAAWFCAVAFLATGIWALAEGFLRERVRSQWGGVQCFTYTVS
jgi:hypothetical protein